MSTPLANDAINAALSDLPGWSYADDKLTKTYKFNSFREALAFIVRIGFEAEAANHHPELFNVYSAVTVSLNTHDAGGKVTQKDVALAGEIERIAWV
ncbi:MAG: 4a-hydroxytetrahydrobiopterin dehydratase [Phycisphaeraceae bacterium]|nr:4a-hydroxytetrahydrobiopterin dehydratase [Phycisphaeraceae bacterium]